MPSYTRSSPCDLLLMIYFDGLIRFIKDVDAGRF